ncbi:hypothetical protein [Dermatobacter hominis]|uniref:hypothetical protein n=1 Tax=Dermatobacter hominis TaxID=2884263 RepID=UPI001D0FEC0D|nr:hypothetical protein [Dermatobacter hominis]UDY37032.1 hypothetical protein LH044_05710 [Dermatobacter hominis]
MSGAGRALVRALLALGLTVAVALGAACSATTTELGGSPDGYPEQSPDGYPSPQVMAEVTLPDGSVSSVPQPEVPVVPVVTDPPEDRTPAQAPSGPTTSVLPADERAVQQLSNAAAIQASSRALGLLRFDWRAILPGWQIRFLPGRSGIRGATFPDRQVIEIYVRSSDGPDELAHVVAHELGHAVDVSRLDDADRQVWRATRGIPAGAAWFPSGSGAPDYSTPAGDWAESFAHWQVGSGWFSKLGPPPDTAQVAVLVRLAGLG